MASSGARSTNPSQLVTLPPSSPISIVSSKSGRIYLNKDLRIFISRKVDLDTATQFANQDYELKAFDEMPNNPKYFSR